MSARGARSRKVAQKEVEKNEKKSEKKVGKSKVTDTTYELHDEFTDWRPTPIVSNARTIVSRSTTATSHATSQSSDTNDSSNRAPDESFSVSDTSSQGKEKIKFQAKGKETSAPRGRGGGVPLQSGVNSLPGSGPRPRIESIASYSSWGHKSWDGFKVWDGMTDKARPYRGFEHDKDMHSGSVLIYFKEEQLDEEQPTPSIRAELDVIKQSGSTWLNNALLIGQIDDSDDDWTLPSSPDHLAPTYTYAHNNIQRESQRTLRTISCEGRPPPPFDIDHANDIIPTRATSRLDRNSKDDHLRRSSSPPPFRRVASQNPTHEIWFTAPELITSAQGQRLHHVAIRNFLAILHGKPIVGADLFDMLSTLQSEIEVMYEFDSRSQPQTALHGRSTQTIIDYLTQHGIDDVRNSIKSAMCLLAWSEQDNVRWRQGYLESFVHLAGVMIPELEEVPEFRRLAIVTRRNLGIAAKTMKLRVMEAEEKFSTFDFGDLWGDMSRVIDRPVYQSYEVFRQFLVNHYVRIYGAWPSPSNNSWLNRKLILRLQEDFGSLYDYLVDRNVVWNPLEERASRKWEMAHRVNPSFKADVPELGLTDMLVAYDAKFGYTHIPHPYPLLPMHIPKPAKDRNKKGFLSSLKKEKSKDATKEAKAHLQLSIVFSDATNIEKLDINFDGSTLIDKFEKFEMTTDLKNTTPREARLGRWALLYGVLQVLSTLSVDVKALKYTDGVRYFLCTDLKRLPEWVTDGDVENLEARQYHSWCWQRSWDPAAIQIVPAELEASSSHDISSRSRRDTEALRSAAIQDQEREAPPPPRLTALNDAQIDGATLMQNEITRINEKINDLSLSHDAHQTLTPDYVLHRENEKVVYPDMREFEPPLDSLYPPTSTSLHRYANNANQYSSRLGSHSTSLNTDLGAYPFTPKQQRLNLSLGHTEVRHRGTSVDYGTTGIDNGYVDVQGKDVDRRNARRIYETGGER